MRAICILGMHRSGTSTIARAVNLLGAYLGGESDLVSPAPDNPEGFWERSDIVDLDDKILNHFRMSWDTNHPLPEGWQRLDEVKSYKNKIAELLRTRFLGHELWAWKDPRTAVLFELWKDVLKDLEIDLVCLFAVRNPLDVARSLEKRDGFTRDKGYGVWFNYNIAALKASTNVQRVFVSYDRFLDDWEGTLKRCANVLNIKWPEDDDHLKQQMKEFIRPSLRHSYSGVKELIETGAPSPVIELYQMLEGITVSYTEPDTGFNKKIDELEKEFSSYSRFYSDDMMRLWELEKHLIKIENMLAEKNRQVNDIYDSYSWKITAPLRKIMGVFKK